MDALSALNDPTVRTAAAVAFGAGVACTLVGTQVVKYLLYNKDEMEFVTQAYNAAKWVVQYRKDLKNNKYPVRSQVEPNYLPKLLPKTAPEKPEPWSAIFSDLTKHIVPGLTHWESPRFFAYFKIHACYASVVGELIACGINVIGFSWITSPSCTELEMVVMDWVARMLNLPESFTSDSDYGGGVIHNAASTAIITAMLAAKQRVLSKLATAEREAAEGKLVYYSSDQAHSSFDKGCRIIGIHPSRIRKITTSAKNNYAMQPLDVDVAIREDSAKGLIPCFVSCTIGTTSTCAIDPVGGIAAICRQQNVWLHVDAAYGGVATCLPEQRHLIKDMEVGVCSFNTNAHKWMMTNFGCSLMWIRDRRPLIQALSNAPEYLRNTLSETGSVIDYKDWEVPLGRRFRAIKLWCVLRRFGKSGIQAHLRASIHRAKLFAKWIETSTEFKLFCPPSFGLACFQALDREGNPDDELGQRVLDYINDSGKAFLTHSKVDGRFFLRACFGGYEQSNEDAEALWHILQDARAAVLGTSP